MPSKYDELNDEQWLREKYHGEGLTQAEIADIVGCSEWTVQQHMKKNGIETRDGGVSCNRLKGGLDAHFVDFIEGELLGDGGLKTYSKSSIGAIYQHTTSREAYRDWLVVKFEDAGFDVISTDRSDSYEMQTLVYRDLMPLYSAWYPEGSKIVPKEYKLSSVGLRQWFIGDGGCSHSGDRTFVTLAAYGFSDGGREHLKREFERKGIEVTIHENGLIYVAKAARERFYEYMADLPKEMEDVYGYKWP